MKNINRNKKIKHYKFVFLLIMLSIIGINVKAQTSKDKQIAKSTAVTYNHVFLDLGFYLPEDWVSQNGIITAQDLKGDTTALIVNYTNNETKSSLSIQFYEKSNGKIIFDAKSKKFLKKTNNIDIIKVLGQKSFVSKETRKYNGKGKLLDNPQEVYIVDFRHTKQSGLFEIQYSFEVKNSNAEENELFNKLLQSLALIN